VVTNDYPPRLGGIQRMLEALVRRLPSEHVAVLCPSAEGAEAAEAYDEGEPYRIFRQPERFLWPTPELARRILRAAEDHGAEVVLFGAVYPLALLGPRLARLGLPYLALAHGFEYWLSILPGTHALMRRATGRATRVMACSAFIARVVRTAVPRDVPVSVLYPGVDTATFRPDLPTRDLRERHGLSDRPVVACVSRLVPRKGQDVLIRAMPMILRRVPEAVLLIVGDGPYRRKLEGMAADLAPRGSVVFTGAVSDEELPRYYRLGQVFAMPCRSRLGGLEVEGWGIVFVEAAACGRPVVVGDSGGAREALVPGETGLLVDGRRVHEVAEAVATLLADPETAERMGRAGRARVERAFTWERAAAQLAAYLSHAM
jgi:phosphatidylinositol alpha-1,6-mannosyltransferase